MILPDGSLDILRIPPLARLGYYDYTTVDSRFEMKSPEGTGLFTRVRGRCPPYPAKGGA